MGNLGVIAALACLVVCNPAQAALVVDQQSATGPFNLGDPSGGVGQSFTPTLTGINFVTFNLLTTTGAGSAHVDLYSGAGFAGSIIASTGSLTVSGTGANPYQFEFSSIVTLVPEALYTFRIVSDTSRLVYANYNNNDNYARGQTYAGNGVSFPAFDLRFVEGINVSAAVPEPASWAMLVAGFGFMGAVLRRRKVAFGLG